MTLPASGAITMAEINTELGYSSSAQVSLNDANVRALLRDSSGAVAMTDGYGITGFIVTFANDGGDYVYEDSTVGTPYGSVSGVPAIGSYTVHGIVDSHASTQFLVTVQAPFNGGTLPTFFNSIIINGVTLTFSGIHNTTWTGSNWVISWLGLVGVGASSYVFSSK